MLTFWGLLTEEDIDHYIGTVLLPSYMSHLKREPFRFDGPSSENNGCRTLRIQYYGDGRVEEYEIEPENHALKMLQSTGLSLNGESIRISREDPIWNWSSAYTRTATDDDDTELSERISLRIYFEPTFEKLGIDATKAFDPRRCHVSVSRKEMFLGREVMQRYFAAWLERLGDEPGLPEMETGPGGWTFHGIRLGGEFVLQENDIFRDLLCFSGLARTLRSVSDQVRLDLSDAETEQDEDGIRFRLVPAIE